MKNYSSPITNYRAALKGFWQRNLLTFVVRDRATGDKVTYNLWDGDDNVTIEVRNQSTGDLEYRDYFGGGHIVSVDSIIRSEGTEVRSLSVGLSGVSQKVLDMIQGYDCREAVFEWHIGEAEEGTGILVDTPVCEFEGFVDMIEHEDSAVDPVGGQADSVFTVSVSSHISTLLRSNPAVRSLEVSRERNDDEIFTHTDASTQWTVMWGKQGVKKKDDKPRGRDKPSISGGGGGSTLGPYPGHR